MKTSLILTMLLPAATMSPAMVILPHQANPADQEVLLFSLNAIAILLSIWIATSFLLTLIRMFLNDRLCRTMIERNTPLEIVTQLLPKSQNLAAAALKWCFILASLGVGLSICYISQPLGLHSAIILSFCMALGLLGFYLISKPGKQSE
jgi:heme/copper-type cytochrome/quinol oxidase subunit 2